MKQPRSLIASVLAATLPTVIYGFSPAILHRAINPSAINPRSHHHHQRQQRLGTSTSSISSITTSTIAVASSSRSDTGFGVESGRPRGNSEDQGRMELLCKAGPDGVSLGDCPFCHFVQMVLRYKGLRYRLVPLAPADKPEWLLEGYGGKMPCLVHDEEAYTDSTTIAQYLEYFFPGETPLTLEDDDLADEIKQATGGVFGAFAKYVKNMNKAEDPKLKDAFIAELTKVDKLLQKTGGPFLAGDRITLDDMSLAPKLYHAKVAVAQFKNIILPHQLEALSGYMNRMFSLGIFEKSSYTPDVICWGWTQARAAAK